jgi:hypothetical protein
MYAISFDSDVIVVRVAVPERDSVTWSFNCDHVFTTVCNHYITKNPVAQIKLLHDYAPAHLSALVQAYLEERIEVLLIPLKKILIFLLVSFD